MNIYWFFETHIDSGIVPRNKRTYIHYCNVSYMLIVGTIIRRNYSNGRKGKIVMCYWLLLL